jgi:hypothetical protein
VAGIQIQTAAAEVMSEKREQRGAEYVLFIFFFSLAAWNVLATPLLMSPTFYF